MAPSATVIVLVAMLCAGVLSAVWLWRLGAGSRRTHARFERTSARLDERDERLTRREATIETKARTLELRESNLLERERAVAAAEAEVDDERAVQRKRLEEIADYSADEARQALVDQVEADARRDAMVIVRDIENRAREEGERRASQIVATAIQRVAVDTTASSAISVVALPDDDMKGRIIGREGRNIRAFEQLTGVNLVVDDTPEAVLLSCFDPVRREVARVALAGLVEDGRIHPASIEAAHERATGQVQAAVVAHGREAVEDVDLDGFDPAIVKLLGELHYRTSYGQNVLRHSRETAHLAGLMAAELGTDAGLARRCGLLHDLGKALTHMVEGTHARVGAEIAARLGEPSRVSHAIEAHHNEVEPRTVEAVLIQAADAISASRPGARRDAHEQFVTRLRRVEELCGACAGVEQVYAMQAGRDVRVMVHPDLVDDVGARVLARDLAARIEAELAYPGQITITVIRELRATGTAR